MLKGKSRAITCVPGSGLFGRPRGIEQRRRTPRMRGLLPCERPWLGSSSAGKSALRPEVHALDGGRAGEVTPKCRSPTDPYGGGALVFLASRFEHRARAVPAHPHDDGFRDADSARLGDRDAHVPGRPSCRMAQGMPRGAMSSYALSLG
jgi:hypothetical protein